MKEIINLCLSQSAGHLQSHFNNQQEAYLDYSTGNHNLVDPTIFLKPTLDKHTKTTSFSPRTILIDAKDGFGSLGKFEYTQTASEPAEVLDKVEKIQLHDRIDKNEYQKLLDLGLLTPKLNSENTKYWTDYTRLIYDAGSFNEIPDWSYNADSRLTVLKFDPSRSMKEFEVGLQTFEKWLKPQQFLLLGDVPDFLDDVFRVFVENCDNLSGLNVVTEIDSAWGGVSSELLVNIKDDFLPKTDTTTWGLYSGKQNSQLSSREWLSRIKSTLSNLSHTSLFVPLNIEPSLVQDHNVWQSSALVSTLFESVNLLYSQRPKNGSKVISMTDFISGLTMNTKRNILNYVHLQQPQVDLTSEMFRVPSNKDSVHFFSKSVVSRYTSSAEFNEFDTLISQGTDQKGLIDYQVWVPFKKSDSFPPDLVPEDQYNVALATTDAVRPVFKEMRTFVSKVMKGDDREWFIDEIESLLAEYEYGWSDDEEYD